MAVGRVLKCQHVKYHSFKARVVVFRLEEDGSSSEADVILLNEIKFEKLEITLDIVSSTDKELPWPDFNIKAKMYLVDDIYALIDAPTVVIALGMGFLMPKSDDQRRDILREYEVPLENGEPACA